MKLLCATLLCFLLTTLGYGSHPRLNIGGGYYEGGKHHSGDLFQLEYYSHNYCFRCVRPLLSIITPEFRSVFVGLGLGFEARITERFFIIPSLSPGIYFKGSGKDLGSPLEFRSSIDLSYEWCNCIRTGFQFYHISNASIGEKNPGLNAYVLYVGIPLGF